MTRNVLITGGAGGLGKETIKHLENEYKVFVTDNDQESLDELELEEEKKYGLDVSQFENADKLSKEIDIDILINCTGVQKQAAIEDAEVKEFEQHLQHNFMTTVNCVKAFLPQLKENKNSKIINVSSVAGRTAMPFLGGYSASKYALEGYTDALRKEMLDRNIQVVLIEPGRVKTGFNEEGLSNVEKYVENSEWKEEYSKLLELESYGGLEPEKAGKKMAKIIQKKRNSPRYSIGSEATILKTIKYILPTKIYDKIMMKFFRKRYF